MDLKAWVGRVKYRIDPKEGTSELEGLNQDHPTNANPYVHLGSAHMNRGLYEESLRVFEDGLRIANEKYPLFAAKANCYSKIGAEDKLEQTRLDAVRQLADLPDPYIALSKHHQDKQEYERARTVLEDAIRQIPDNDMLLAGYALLITDHFEAKEALPVYDDLVSLSPTSPGHRTRRANLLNQLGLNDLAMSDYKRATDLADDKEAWILANISNLFKNRGFYQEGITYLKRALDISPDDDYAHERLAQALKLRSEERKKADEIRKEIERAMAERRRTQHEGPAAQT